VEPHHRKTLLGMVVLNFQHAVDRSVIDVRHVNPFDIQLITLPQHLCAILVKILNIDMSVRIGPMNHNKN
jgi:hypothetical protein